MNDYPLMGAMWTMFVFFAWVIWFWLLIMMFGDIFRRQDISGWAKAGWFVVVLVLPYLGVLIYLITQGRSMSERARVESETTRMQFDDHIRSVASSNGGGPADEIAKAKRLLDSGSITSQEYEDLKQKALSR
ncbi:MAG TPA: SHOCT domain-containing protein [Kineosporiaceae bacterium]|nr:SHOCT domain-containing protein [Kineosporiaceae bacterium]